MDQPVRARHVPDNVGSAIIVGRSRAKGPPEVNGLEAHLMSRHGKDAQFLARLDVPALAQLHAAERDVRHF